MTENKRFDSYFDDYMRLWTVSDNENDNMLYPCTSENMANEFCKLLNELNDENKHLNYDNKRMVKFIMSKGYGLKDYLDFCKEYKE